MIMKSTKRETTEEIELLDHENIRTLGIKKYDNFSGIQEADTIKQAGLKKIKLLKRKFQKD